MMYAASFELVTERINDFMKSQNLLEQVWDYHLQIKSNLTEHLQDQAKILAPC